MRQFTAELHSSGFLCRKRLHLHVALGCLVNSVLNSNWFALILNCIEPNTRERERKKKPRWCVCFSATENNAGRTLIGIGAREGCKFPCGSARLNCWESWLAFILQRPRLTFLLSRANRDLWNYCCETFAAGSLFIWWLHTCVSELRDAHSRAKERVRERAGVLRHSVSVTRLHRLRCSPLTGQIHFLYLSFMNFDQL